MPSKRKSKSKSKRKPKYSARPGYRIKPKDALTIGKLVEEYDGVITAGELLHEAAKKKSSLHHLFEWDDDIAAHEYRLGQARYYLRGIEVRLHGGGVIKNMHAVTLDGGAEAYVNINFAKRNRDVQAQIVEQARRELEGWYARYATYSEFFGVAKQIRCFLDSPLKIGKKSSAAGG